MPPGKEVATPGRFQESAAGKPAHQRIFLNFRENPEPDAMKTNAFLLLLSLMGTIAAAQPGNDNCTDAVVIEDPVNYCSSAGAFTTLMATEEPGLNPSCFTAEADVWFRFTAIAPSVSIAVLGGFFSGQLSQPSIALYTGNCGSLAEVDCLNGTGLGLSLQEIFNGLNLGTTYYVQVQGAVAGTFTLCLNNYTSDIPAVSDCPEAAVLCNRDPFVIPQVANAGNDPNEADDAACLNIAGTPVESFSTWFVWTAAEAGSLTFSLAPINEPDDLDFVLYEFPNGPGDCSGKTVLRCMASSCFGATGLQEGATDTSEPPGCGAAQDNFLAPLQMEAGVTYGLMVNNFSQTTIGFRMEFGGTGSFFGGEERLSVESQEICQDSLLTFTGLNPPGSPPVTNWEWEFGAGATPLSASGPGPHEVAFNNGGTQLVLLRATTAQGCASTEIVPVEVICCADNFTVEPNVSPPGCVSNGDGSIGLQVESPDGPPFTITWEDGTADNPRTGLSPGNYSVTIADSTGCQTVRSFELSAVAPFQFDTLLTPPSCDAGTDGSITLETTGGQPPYLYAWEGGAFDTIPTLGNLPAGNYSVIVQDEAGCTDTLAIGLQELQLTLDPQVTEIIAPACNGGNNGRIVLSVANGLPPYQFDFNDGNGYVSSNALTQLPAGTYAVNILDENLCEGQFVFELEDPTVLSVDLAGSPISCAGADDGSLNAQPNGGTPSYAFSWSNGLSTAQLDSLGPGNYGVTVTDANGCTADTAFELGAPLPVMAFIDSTSAPGCVGEASGVIVGQAEGGQPPYTYQLNNSAQQPSPAFSDLLPGAYELTVMDSRNCSAQASATLPEPQPLEIFLPEVAPVVLGYSTTLQATSNAAGAAFTWSPPQYLSCTDCPEPGVERPLATLTYAVQATTPDGCTALDSVQLFVLPEYPAYLPNAFSPNDDGINDLWAPQGGPALEAWLSIKVFDRWGGLLYTAENLSGGNPVVEWDGQAENKPAPVGVYTCIVEGQFIDGTVRRFQSDVLLTR